MIGGLNAKISWDEWRFKALISFRKNSGEAFVAVGSYLVADIANCHDRSSAISNCLRTDDLWQELGAWRIPK